MNRHKTLSPKPEEAAKSPTTLNNLMSQSWELSHHAVFFAPLACQDTYEVIYHTSEARGALQNFRVRVWGLGVWGLAFLQGIYKRQGVQEQ